MNFETLNDDNFMFYAMRSYERPSLVMSEFEEDMKRIQYLQKLFYRYQQYNDLRERLILNHLIILNNVFGTEAASKLLFYKIPDCYYSLLKTFMLFLSILPEKIHGVKDSVIHTNDIQVNLKVAKILRDI